MLNACFTNQLDDNNNNIKYIVEATKNEKIDHWRIIYHYRHCPAVKEIFA